MSDLEIIKQLEFELGKSLKPKKNSKEKLLNSYFTDSQENVIDLCVSNNGLQTFPNTILLFQNLIKLDIQNNKIHTIPNEIDKLQYLKYLNLSQNNIKELPKSFYSLVNLLELDISYNSIRKIDSDILNLKKLEFFFPVSNPLKSPPPEIIDKGLNSLFTYFKKLESEESFPLNELKVLLVGEGGAGKTSLIKRILGKEFNEHEPQTHGININNWSFKNENSDIKVNFWDFGGQEIMHSTHQFFLSKRSVYILVLDGRKEENPEYWLKLIESFGGNSPIIIVLNKTDENPHFDVNRKFLQNKYKGILEFHKISCKKNSGTKSIINSIKKSIHYVEILETKWPKSWFNVKSFLESLKESFISINLYEKICKNNNVNTHEDQSTLVDFLNDLGVVLHFKDFRLLDTHVLEPRWVTGAVYKIINSEKLEECNGILNLSLLSNILDKNNVDDFYYPKSKYKYIIDLMLKFELCYEICDNQVLIPDLLNIQEPEVILDDDVLIYHLVYDFLPRSIIPRFIVKLNKNIHNRLQWRTGVILKDNVSETIAVIKADYIERLITVSIHGKNKRDFLSVILYTLRNINSDFEKLKVIEKVAMPDNKNVFVSYKHLLVLEKNGIQKYMPEGSEKEYDVKQLLGTVQSSNASEKELIALLIKIIDKHDTVESMLQKANDIIQLQPNFFGLGVNLNAIIEKIAKKKKIKGHNK